MKKNSLGDMNLAAERTAYLIAGYIQNTLTEKEHDELDNWINEDDHNMQLFEELTDEQNILVNMEWMDEAYVLQSFKALQEKGVFNLQTKKVYNKNWLPIAASVIILLGLFFIYKYTVTNKPITNERVIADTNALKPGGNFASLTLANGNIIDLSAAKIGAIVLDSGAHINKTGDGVLQYENFSNGSNGSNGSNAAAIHTLSTPAGGQYQITLADGTKVWLNAATVLKFPAAFIGNQREVTLIGEAYFEVAKNVNRPFKVLLADNARVEVTGTHFNINNYENETAQEVTLLEGGITVATNKGITKLEPGTQALINKEETKKLNLADAEEITGWKDGLFVFKDAPIESIMMQIERWYKAKIIYKTKSKQLFNATILRKEPLTKVLKLLELNGYVHFEIKNETIYVLP